MTEKHLTTRQLSNRLDGIVSVKTFANWRSDPHAKGPPFRRVGGRIFYALPDVERWLEGTRFETTRDYVTDRA